MSSRQLSLFGDLPTDYSGDLLAIRSIHPANTSKVQPGQFSPLIPDEAAGISRGIVPGDLFRDVTEEARTAGFDSRRWAAVHISCEFLEKLEPTLIEKDTGIEMQPEARLWNVLWASWHQSFMLMSSSSPSGWTASAIPTAEKPSRKRYASISSSSGKRPSRWS